MNTPLTNEQKLDAIYEMLLDQSRVRTRAMWLGLIRRIVVYGGLLYLALHPSFLIDRVMESVKPMISKMSQDMIEEQKAKLGDSLDSQMESLKSRLGK